MKGKRVFLVCTTTLETGLHRNIIDIFSNEEDAKDYVDSHKKLLKSEGIGIHYFSTIVK